MTFTIVFRAPALIEFCEAADFYESKDAGLGSAFVMEIERCLSLIKKHLFAIHYYLETERIVVIGIFHSSRNPAIWQDRI